jgi:Spy/CpxP family protein refolding chaperone
MQKKENQPMNRIRLLAVGAALVCAVPAIANQTPPAPTEHLPSVDRHLAVLSQKLDLTADQKEKARPILKEMQDAMQKAMDDKSLTEEQMHEQMRPAKLKADKALREILTDDQKKKLDAMEADLHPGVQN